jgi:capsule polysaccharide export protein KpsE/RkpR
VFVDMFAMLKVILRHKRVMIAVTLGGFVLSAVVSIVTPSRYMASVTFLPLGVERDITGLRGFFAPMGTFGESFAAYLRARKNYIIDFFLRSRRMSDLIDAHVGLREAYGTNDPERIRRELQRHTRVIIRNEGVIILTVEDRSPKRALAITRDYMQFLDSLLVDSAVKSAQDRIAFLADEIKEREAQIAASDSLLRDFLETNGLYDMQQQVRVTLDVVSDLSSRLSIIDVEKRLLEMTMRPGSPDLDRAQLEWNKLREQLLLLRETGAEPRVFPPLKRLPEITAQYAHMMSQRKSTEFVLGYLRIRLEDAQVSAKSRVSVLRLLDPPTLPEKRSWPKRKQIVLASTAAAFFWAAFVLMVRERWKEGAFRERRPGAASASPRRPREETEGG